MTELEGVINFLDFGARRPWAALACAWATCIAPVITLRPRWRTFAESTPI